jgi:hypothetical protein
MDGIYTKLTTFVLEKKRHLFPRFIINLARKQIISLFNQRKTIGFYRLSQIKRRIPSIQLQHLSSEKHNI